MSNQPKKPALKDLSKLSSIAQITVQNTVQKPAPTADTELNLDVIYTRPQVRKRFRNLEELAESIKLNGIIEPLIVHAEPDGRYRLIIGERRFRAAPLAKLTKVPVIIKRGLTELQIRALQVAENNDRDNLSAFEEAQGVIEDVETYGTKEAQQIWNRSEGWISKRMATKRYAEPVKELLVTDLCGDFEVLHSLNQLHDVDSVSFEKICHRLNEGVPLSRDEARNTVSRAKAHKQNQEEFAQRREQIRKNEQTSTENEQEESVTSTEQLPAEATTPRQETGQEQLSPLPPSVDQAKRVLETCRRDVIHSGHANLVHFQKMKEQMTALDYDLNDTEWVLWQSFCCSILPALEGIGAERAIIYLKKLQSEMKGKPPQELLSTFNISASKKAALPDKPEKWHF